MTKLIVTLVVALVCYAMWWVIANVEDDPATTASNARVACAQHDHVKELQNPGSTGAYVVCRDGYLTKVGNGDGANLVHPVRWLP